MKKPRQMSLEECRSKDHKMEMHRDTMNALMKYFSGEVDNFTVTFSKTDHGQDTVGMSNGGSFGATDPYGEAFVAATSISHAMGKNSSFSMTDKGAFVVAFCFMLLDDLKGRKFSKKLKGLPTQVGILYGIRHSSAWEVISKSSPDTAKEMQRVISKFTGGNDGRNSKVRKVSDTLQGKTGRKGCERTPGKK